MRGERHEMPGLIIDGNIKGKRSVNRRKKFMVQRS